MRERNLRRRIRNPKLSKWPKCWQEAEFLLNFSTKILNLRSSQTSSRNTGGRYVFCNQYCNNNLIMKNMISFHIFKVQKWSRTIREVCELQSLPRGGGQPQHRRVRGRWNSRTRNYQIRRLEPQRNQYSVAGLQARAKLRCSDQRDRLREDLLWHGNSRRLERISGHSCEESRLAFIEIISQNFFR